MPNANTPCTVNFTNGNSPDSHEAVWAAIDSLRSTYGHYLYVAPDWETRTPETVRKLVWTNEDDSLNDSGANAIAEIVCER